MVGNPTVLLTEALAPGTLPAQSETTFRVGTTQTFDRLMMLRTIRDIHRLRTFRRQPMRQRSSFSISRQVHIILCGLCLLLVSWALLSRDPMALVRGSRLSFVQTISDVILHFGVYSVFSLCCLSLTRRSSDSPVRRTILFLLILHGVGTELLQGLIPTRTCDARDALANLTGITAGALLAAWATRQTTATSPVTRAG